MIIHCNDRLADRMVNVMQTLQICQTDWRDVEGDALTILMKCFLCCGFRMVSFTHETDT
jgi:hypothetical protein